MENVRLRLYARGIRTIAADDPGLGRHDAFWLAWSQFHPGTALWPAR